MKEKVPGRDLIWIYKRKKLKRETWEKSDLIKNPPQGLGSEEVEEILTNIDAYEDLDNLDIIETDKDIYYYDILLWTCSICRHCCNIRRKDINKAIATRARRDCKIYPRPLKLLPFMNHHIHIVKKKLKEP